MSLLIRNVRVLGSPKKLPERTDVFVTGTTISAIGSFPRKEADVTIDGEGAYLAPGFIDVDTTSDHYLSLFEDLGQEDFLRQGVTTMIGGHCGASLAPLYYGELSSFRKWANLRAVNVNWRTVREFLAVLQRRRPGVNFGTFAGHSTMRRELTGEAIRDLTRNEIKVMGGILDRALKEGAFGLSTGLEYIHTRGTPYSELKSFLEIVGRARAIHSTHLRHTGPGVLEALEETLKLGRETGAKTLITHFMPRKGSEEEYRKALDLLASLPADRQVRFAVDPFPWRTVPLYRLLPDWAQNGNLELMSKSVADEWLSKRILKDIEEIGAHDLRVEEAPGNAVFTGKTLQEVMEDAETDDPKQALLILMRATNLRAVVSVRDIREDLLREAMGHPRALIGSHAPAFSSSTFSLRRTFEEFLRQAGEHHLPLAEAVSRITRDPAEFLELDRRGEIKEGNIADLCLFKEAEVRASVVRGVVAFTNGQMTSERNGEVLARKK